MAAGTSLPDSPRTRGLSDSGTHVIECDRYIETELARTRRQVKGVDLASSCMLLAVATLVYLMLMALADHWLVTGGLGFAGRAVAFMVLATGVLAFAALRLLPLLMRRINPVYAAYTIERNRPGIKNSLINFLLLRSDQQRLPERIYQAMETQAANALTATHAEVAVDRTPVIRLLMAMVAVVFCIALYAVFSPKNPFTSFRRVVSPWADVAPPTRVSISDIQPGDGRGFHDQHVAVTALVDGLRGGETVNLRYSTVDGQVIGRSVAMNLPESSYRYAVELPPDNLGLQQDLEYWIEAGDATSPRYRIKVDTSPAILVEEIEYQYPKYSELPPRKVARHGDIQALAGTRVTLRAKANQLIREASVDFECDGRNDLNMKIDGTKAEVSFIVEWNDKARRAEHESYQLRFRNEEGHENPKPIRYAIEVIRDLAPEIEIVEPELDASKELMVPAAKPVTFGVQAADPDFKLAAVKFFARRDGMPLDEASLLAEPRAGQFKREYLLDLKRLGVKPGEEVEFWAAADDNREPTANHAETPHYRLRVATPDKNQEEQDQAQDGNQDNQRQPKQDRNQRNKQGNRGQGDQQQEGEEGQEGEKQPQDKEQSGKNSGKQRQRQQKQDGGSDEKQQQNGGGQQEGSEKQSGSAGENQSEKQSGEGSESGNAEKKSGQGGGQDKRLDPERDAGKAIDEINKHYDQKEKQENQPDQKSPAEKSQGGGKKQEGQESGEKQSGEKQSGNDKQSGEKQSGQQPNEKQPAEGQPSDQRQTGDKQAGQKSSDKPGKQQGEAGNQEPGKPQEKQSRDGQSSNGQESTSGQTGEKKESGEKKSGKPDKKDQENNSALADKNNDKKPGAGEQGSAGGEAHKGEGEKHGQQESKGGKQPSNGDGQAKGQEQGVRNDGGEKATEKDKSGGGKEGEAKVGDEQEKNADGQTKPRAGQGGQAKGPGERDEKVKKHEGESPDQKGGDQDSQEKGEGGAGDSEGANKHGAPTTHTANKQRDKKELSPDAKKGTSEDEAESSAESKRQSDSQGGQQGEQEGGGKSGGGQRSNSEGTGSAGQNSEADQGGGKGETRGKGPTGEKGGDQQKSDKPTGGKSSGEKGEGTNQGTSEQSNSGEPSESPETADGRGRTNKSRQPGKPNEGDKQPPPDEKQQPKQPQGQKQPNQRSSNGGKQSPDGQRSPSDRGGNDLRGGKQRSNPVDGGQAGDEETTEPAEVDNSEPGGDEANLEYARKATDLALNRLKDQLAKGKPDPELMEKLKWSPEDMQRFYDQWERLKKSADETGPKGDAARQELDDALRSLGLRHRSTSLSGQKRDDAVRNLREGRRSAPPAEFQEQWIEFNKATARSRK